MIEIRWSPEKKSNVQNKEVWTDKGLDLPLYEFEGDMIRVYNTYGEIIDFEKMYMWEEKYLCN